LLENSNIAIRGRWGIAPQGRKKQNRSPMQKKT